MSDAVPSCTPNQVPQGQTKPLHSPSGLLSKFTTLETGSGKEAASHAQDTEPSLKESHPSIKSQNTNSTAAPSHEASTEVGHEPITEEAHSEPVVSHGGSEPRSFKQTNMAWGTMMAGTNTIPVSFQVSVRNLNTEVRIGDIIHLFSQVGEVRGARIFYFATSVNKTSGKTPFKNFSAVVEFAEEASVTAAISRFDGALFKEKTIYVTKRVAKCVCLYRF